MSHSPEQVARYICSSCQLVHAGTPSRTPAGKRRFDPPEACGGCGEEKLVPLENWIHYSSEE